MKKAVTWFYFPIIFSLKNYKVNFLCYLIRASGFYVGVANIRKVWLIKSLQALGRTFYSNICRGHYLWTTSHNRMHRNVLILENSYFSPCKLGVYLQHLTLWRNAKETLGDVWHSAVLRMERGLVAFGKPGKPLNSFGLENSNRNLWLFCSATGKKEMARRWCRLNISAPFLVPQNVLISKKKGKKEMRKVEKKKKKRLARNIIIS